MAKKKTEKLERIRIFIGSPSDLDEERKAFSGLIDHINKIKAKPMGLILEAIGWEDTLPGKGRPQDKINADLLGCKLLVMLLWKRWGVSREDSSYSSGFEEEYELGKRSDKEIFFYFKRIPDEMFADPGLHLIQVIAFRDKIESENNYLYTAYENIEEWQRLLVEHICSWLDNLPITRPDISLLMEKAAKFGALEMKLAQQSASNVQKAQEYAHKANEMAESGRITKAQEYYAVALSLARLPSILNDYAHFQARIGLIDDAVEKCRHLILFGIDIGNPEIMSIGYSNLGLLYKDQGDLDKAEEMYRKALTIDEKLNLKMEMATVYGNLGNLYLLRGDLDTAEEMHKKALAIDESLGLEEEMAKHYSNLGSLYQTRGDLDEAEELHNQAVAIYETFDRKEELAIIYGNLGALYDTRGDSDKAEEMFQKALAIDEKLGIKKGMADQFGNLGILYKNRGDLDKSEGVYRKALAIYEELGFKNGMAIVYGNLGVLYDNRGDLDKAEEMIRRSLAINQEIGSKGGMAYQYINLGDLYKSRTEYSPAVEMYKKALALFLSIGIPDMIKKTEALLKTLDENHA